MKIGGFFNEIWLFGMGILCHNLVKITAIFLYRYFIIRPNLGNNVMKKITAGAALITGLMGVSLSHAQSLPIDNNARLKLGANASINHYGYDKDNDITLMPQAFYDNNRLYIEGSEAGVYGYKDANNEWRLTASYDGRAFDPNDSDHAAIKHLDERKWSALIGSSYMRITPYGGFKVQAETDALGRSDGTTAKIAHLSKFKAMDNKLTVYPELGLQWYNDKYNDYYFGVSQQEAARSGVSRYQADSSVNPYFNISASYNFTPRWSGFVSQHLEYLSDTQKDSPLVDSRIDSKTKVGFNYQF
jgi:outer membrane protein